MNWPSRPRRGALHARQVISRSCAGAASTRTTSYRAPQSGHLKGGEWGVGTVRLYRSLWHVGTPHNRTRRMPRKQPKLILAAHRVAEARRIVARQLAAIAVLKAKGKSSAEAEGMLDVYLSSLKLLEEHEWKIRQERKAKKGETKKPRLNR